MRNIEELLRNWRESRNIKDFPSTIKEDLLSEIEEVKQALDNRDWDNYVEELADIGIFAFNGIGLLNTHYKPRKSFIAASLNQIESYVNNIMIDNVFQTYEILCKIISLCEELVTDKKYDFEKVLNEKIKLLNSRKQCPKQKKEWNQNGVNGKWQKMKDQPKETLYIPNYGKCKI